MLAEEIGVAYSAFVERVSAAVADDRALERVAAAYGRYAALAEKGMTDEARAAFESYRTLLQGHLSPDPVRLKVQDAFQRFTHAVAAAWTNPSLDPVEVTTAAETMLGAAWLATVASGGDATNDADPMGSSPVHEGARDAETAHGQFVANGVASEQPAATPHPLTTSNSFASASVWGPTTVLE
jgi:hypothetical protein